MFTATILEMASFETPVLSARSQIYKFTSRRVFNVSMPVILTQLIIINKQVSVLVKRLIDAGYDRGRAMSLNHMPLENGEACH